MERNATYRVYLFLAECVLAKVPALKAFFEVHAKVYLYADHGLTFPTCTEKVTIEAVKRNFDGKFAWQSRSKKHFNLQNNGKRAKNYRKRKITTLKMSARVTFTAKATGCGR